MRDWFKRMDEEFLDLKAKAWSKGWALSETSDEFVLSAPGIKLMFGNKDSLRKYLEDL